MLEHSEQLKMVFVSVKMDILNLFMKMESNNVNHVQANVKLVFKVQFNALHVIQISTEFKDMIA